MIVKWCWPLQPDILELGIIKMLKHGLLILLHYVRKNSPFGCRCLNFRVNVPKSFTGVKKHVRQFAPFAGIYDYKERTSGPKASIAATQATGGEYVTRKEFDALAAKLAALEKQEAPESEKEG